MFKIILKSQHICGRRAPQNYSTFPCSDFACCTIRNSWAINQKFTGERRYAQGGGLKTAQGHGKIDMGREKRRTAHFL